MYKNRLVFYLLFISSFIICCNCDGNVEDIIKNNGQKVFNLPKVNDPKPDESSLQSPEHNIDHHEEEQNNIADVENSEEIDTLNDIFETALHRVQVTAPAENQPNKDDEEIPIEVFEYEKLLSIENDKFPKLTYTPRDNVWRLLQTVIPSRKERHTFVFYRPEEEDIVRVEQIIHSELKGEEKIEKKVSTVNLPPLPPTPVEREAKRLYEEAFITLNSSHNLTPKIAAKAYDTLRRSAELGYLGAKEQLAWSKLSGQHFTKIDLETAHADLKKLADMYGSPKGQLGLGLLYSTGLASLNASHAKSLVYLTFASLGGEPWADMALGYRYWAGLGVDSNCETALTHYRRVAGQVSTKTILFPSFC